jgi:hypothetical protein
MAITRYGLSQKKPLNTLIPSTGPTPARMVTGDTPFDTSPTGGTTDATGTGAFETTDGGTGSTSGAYSYAAALAKIKADQEAATAAATRATEGAKYQAGQLQKQLLTAGQIDPTLLTTLEDQRTAQQKYIADQLAAQQAQLGTAYTTASGLQTQGFDALRNYLTSNAPTAYAQAPRATAAPIANDLAQYMQGQGVDAARVEPGLLAAQAAAQGGASNYNNLLGVLTAQSGAGQESRLAEQQMAQQLAAAQLGAYKAQQEGTLTTQQLAALQEIQTQYNTAKFQAQKDAIARQQALQDALNSLYGTGYVAPPPPAPPAPVEGPISNPVLDPTTYVAPKAPTPLEQLLNIPVKASNTALIKRVADFAAAKPNASAAAVAKAFPELAKTIAKKGK